MEQKEIWIMKRILKVVSGFVAIAALSCLLAVPAQARTFVSVNVGFPGFGFSYGGYQRCASFYPGYCYARPVYYRPACGYYAPVCYYGGGYYCR
jgi:hypothetical protein